MDEKHALIIHNKILLCGWATMMMMMCGGRCITGFQPVHVRMRNITLVLYFLFAIHLLKWLLLATADFLE